MKWMEHDMKRNRLLFKLEEHEIVDGMKHILYLSGPATQDSRIENKEISAGPALVNSNWELIFNLPEEIPLVLGRWEFHTNGLSDMKGSFIVATGFSINDRFVCHQACSKRPVK